jgi:hypothetical protein
VSLFILWRFLTLRLCSLEWNMIRWLWTMYRLNCSLSTSVSLPLIGLVYSLVKSNTMKRMNVAIVLIFEVEHALASLNVRTDILWWCSFKIHTSVECSEKCTFRHTLPQFSFKYFLLSLCYCTYVHVMRNRERLSSLYSAALIAVKFSSPVF